MVQLTSNLFFKKRVFILAGGESIKKVNYSLLQEEFVISINKCFSEYPNAFINYAQDYSFYQKITSGGYSDEITTKWNEFQGLKVFLSPFSSQYFDGNIQLIRRTTKKEVSFSFEEGIYGGTNSGLGAIMLAILLGCSEIYLLGYDLQAEKQTHWHGGYGQDIERFRHDLGVYLNEISEVAELIKQAGVNVYNLNLGSALKCFEFRELSEVLSNKGDS